MTLLLNIVFVVVMFSLNLVPRDLIAARIRGAFATEQLSDQDYLPYDYERGWHQYNDCNILQMAFNVDHSWMGRSLGPWLLVADADYTNVCQTLGDLVHDRVDHTTLVASRYTRYWHGYLPFTAMLLVFFELATVRYLLRALLCVPILVLVMVARRERQVAALAGAIAAACALFWALPYFGLGLSHAFSDLVLLVGISSLIVGRRQLREPQVLIPFCAGYGALLMFFEMLTGSLLTAAGLLLPTVYVNSRLNRPTGGLDHYHFRLALAALSALIIGAGLTASVKLGLAFALVQPNGLDMFVGNLEIYTQPVSPPTFIPHFLVPFGRLLRRGAILTYGNLLGQIGLYAASLSVWVGAVLLTWRKKAATAWWDYAVFLLGAVSVPLWTIILPTHTFMHADFMVRMLIVPLALGWALFFWQLCGPATAKRDAVSAPRSVAGQGQFAS